MLSRGRQRRHHELPFRRQVERSPVTCHPDFDDQVLNRVRLVPLEPPAWFGCERHHMVVIDDQSRAFGLALLSPRSPTLLLGRTVAGCHSRLRIGALLHSARLDLGPSFQILEPGNLFGLRRHHRFKLGIRLQKPNHQRPQLICGTGGQIGNARRGCHAPRESQTRNEGNPPISTFRFFLPTSLAIGF